MTMNRMDMLRIIIHNTMDLMTKNQDITWTTRDYIEFILSIKSSFNRVDYKEFSSRYKCKEIF